MIRLSPQAELSLWPYLSSSSLLFLRVSGQNKTSLQAPLINFPFPIMKKFGERGHGTLLADPSRLITSTVAVTFSAGPAVANEERWQQREEGPLSGTIVQFLITGGSLENGIMLNSQHPLI